MVDLKSLVKVTKNLVSISSCPVEFICNVVAVGLSDLLMSAIFA